MKNATLPPAGRALAIQGAFALAMALGLSAPPAVRAVPAAEPRVTVEFDHPEKFLDIKIWRIPADEAKDRRAVMTAFREFITQRAAAYLPEGYRLSMKFTDMKLAGQFPPGGGGDTRVVNEHFPPVFVFSWTVTNRSGAVVKTGTENLMETSFMELYGATLDSGPYHFEKAVLDDWMRRNLRI
jgi:hypothetical protein